MKERCPNVKRKTCPERTQCISQGPVRHYTVPQLSAPTRHDRAKPGTTAVNSVSVLAPTGLQLSMRMRDLELQALRDIARQHVTGREFMPW